MRLPCTPGTKAGERRVFYSRPGLSQFATIGKLLRETTHDVLYINSFFSPMFSIWPLLLGRLDRIPRKPIVLAPRRAFAGRAHAQGETQVGVSRIGPPARDSPSRDLARVQRRRRIGPPQPVWPNRRDLCRAATYFYPARKTRDYRIKSFRGVCRPFCFCRESMKKRTCCWRWRRFKAWLATWSSISSAPLATRAIGRSVAGKSPRCRPTSA